MRILSNFDTVKPSINAISCILYDEDIKEKGTVRIVHRLRLISNLVKQDSDSYVLNVFNQKFSVVDIESYNLSAQFSKVVSGSPICASSYIPAGLQSPIELQGARSFNKMFRVVEFEDYAEMLASLPILRSSRYIFVFNKRTDLTVADFISTMEPEQKTAVMKNDEVIWLGKASQLVSCEDAGEIKSAAIKKLESTSSAFCTFHGGNAQCWSGLIIQI